MLRLFPCKAFIISDTVKWDPIPTSSPQQKTHLTQMATWKNALCQQSLAHLKARST